MEACPCHRDIQTCPDAATATYSVPRKGGLHPTILRAAEADQGLYTNHPNAGGKRKPAQVKLHWRPRLAV